MASRSQPIFIPDRVPHTQQTGMGPYNQANRYPGQLDVEHSDHGTSTSFLNQDPHTPDIDTVYGSVSPLIPTFESSLPEPSWTHFDAHRMLYSANNSPESSFRVGRSGTTVADEAPRTMNNFMPPSTHFMSQDRDVPRTFVGSQSSALSALIPPGQPLPVDTEYVHFENALTGHLFCLSNILY